MSVSLRLLLGIDMKHILSLLIAIFAVCSSSHAANFPLEITNIKPAGTGGGATHNWINRSGVAEVSTEPNIPSTNRIFRAYPGIEYNIQAAVIGGLYPFTYSLSNAPAGMTINSATGEIKWSNPQTNSGTITLSVSDSENTTVSTTWEITVTTEGFLFVDSSYIGTQTGSITQPFNSILSMAQNTTSADMTKIVYFRGGDYSFELYRDDGNGNRMALYDRPFTWIGYPGEAANISGNNSIYGRFYKIYFDSLHFHDMMNNGVMFGGSESFSVIRRCTWSHITTNNAVNNNQGFFYATDGDPGFFSVIQDNELSDYTGTAGMGSLYDMNKLLIANNYIHNEGGVGITGINASIAIKSRTNMLTIRGNKIVRASGTFFGSNMNSMMYNANGIDICFNFLQSTGAEGVNISINSRSDGQVHNVNFYRNTLVGNVAFENIDGSACGTDGPFVISGNVIINSNAYSSWDVGVLNFISYYTPTAINSPENCVTDTDNLKGLPAANLVNANGLLANSSYIGVYGWETTPIPSARKSLPFRACDESGCHPMRSPQ